MTERFAMSTNFPKMGTIHIHLNDDETSELESLTPDDLTDLIREAFTKTASEVARHSVNSATNRDGYVRCYIGTAEVWVYGAVAYWECDECGAEMDDHYERCEDCED